MTAVGRRRQPWAGHVGGRPADSPESGGHHCPDWRLNAAPAHLCPRGKRVARGSCRKQRASPLLAGHRPEGDTAGFRAEGAGAVSPAPRCLVCPVCVLGSAQDNAARHLSARALATLRVWEADAADLVLCSSGALSLGSCALAPTPGSSLSKPSPRVSAGRGGGREEEGAGAPVCGASATPDGLPPLLCLHWHPRATATVSGQHRSPGRSQEHRLSACAVPGEMHITQEQEAPPQAQQPEPPRWLGQVDGRARRASRATRVAPACLSGANPHMLQGTTRPLEERAALQSLPSVPAQ